MAQETQEIGGVCQAALLSLCGRHSSNGSHAGKAFTAYRPLYERFRFVEAILQRPCLALEVWLQCYSY